MFSYKHRQEHEPPVLVDHPHRLRTLLCQHFEPEAVHRADLNIEQAIGLKVFQRLLFCHQSVLIRHQNKRLTPMLFYTVIDETLLVNILPACKQSKHLLVIRLPMQRPAIALRGRKHLCLHPLPPPRCRPRLLYAYPSPSYMAEKRNF